MGNCCIETQTNNNPRRHKLSANNIFNKTKSMLESKQIISNTLINKSKTNKSTNISSNFNSIPNEKNENKFFNFEDFQKSTEFIGKGHYNIIYQGLNIKTGQIVAIKIFDNLNSDKINLIKKNIEKIYKLNHPNLIKPIFIKNYENCYFEDSNNVKNFSIIYELCNGNSIEQIIKEYGKNALNEFLLQKYIKQCIEGLEYLHKNNVIHMNIKLNNIFIERDGTIKISDSLVDNICFGEISEVVENLNDDEDENEINNFYLAPFVIQNYFKDNKYKIDRSYDFWCLGCSLIEILRGKNKNDDNFYYKKFKNGKEFLNFLKETKSLPKINNDDNNNNKKISII